MEEKEFMRLARGAALEAQLIMLRIELETLDGLIAIRAGGEWMAERREVVLGMLDRIKVAYSEDR